jgi:hypothetical protein
MSCAEVEILICDYLDGTLTAAGRADVERHLAGCAECAGLARDAQAAVSFMERAAEVEVPPELVNRILFSRQGPEKRTLKVGAGKWLDSFVHAALRPKLVMSMALTILSFSMLSKFQPVRQLTAADLQPMRVWASIEDRSVRTWERTVKFYQNLKVVYQFQSKLREWQQQQDEEQRLTGDAEEHKPDERKLPVKKAPEIRAAPEREAQ